MVFPGEDRKTGCWKRIGQRGEKKWDVLKEKISNKTKKKLHGTLKKSHAAECEKDNNNREHKCKG